MPKFFIDRPIFAWVLAIITMMAGVMALRNIPIEQYPSIAPPSVSISTSLPGASAEVLEKLGSDAQISITREFYPNLDWSILWSEKSPPVPQDRPYTEHVEGTPSRVMEALTLQIKASHYFKNGEVLFPNVPIVMRVFGTAVTCERRVKPAIHFVEVIVPVVDAESHNTIVDDMDAKIAAAVEVEMSLNRHRLANAGLIQ